MKSINFRSFNLSLRFAVLLPAALSVSCSTAPDRDTAVTTVAPAAREITLEVDYSPDIVLPLYYSDLISFRDTGKRPLLGFDPVSDLYYVSGNANAEFSSGDLRFESVKLPSGDPAGMSCTEKNTIITSDSDGNLFLMKRTGPEKWVTEKLFSAGWKKGSCTAMAADEKHVYLFKAGENRVYRYSYSGVAGLSILLDMEKAPPADGKKPGKVASMEAKSGYLYIRFDSGAIILVDSAELDIETVLYPVNADPAGNLFIVRHEETESDILAQAPASGGSISYAVYPLTSMHLMRLVEGFVRKAVPEVSGCSHVIADSSGSIVFPVKSNLLDLDAIPSGKVTVTGRIHETEAGSILMISSVDY